MTYTSDVLNEFNLKMTLSKSGITFKILQYLAEPSKVLENVVVGSDFCEIEQILSIYAQP